MARRYLQNVPTTREQPGAPRMGQQLAFERARVIGGCSAHNGCAQLPGGAVTTMPGRHQGARDGAPRTCGWLITVSSMMVGVGHVLGQGQLGQTIGLHQLRPRGLAVGQSQCDDAAALGSEHRLDVVGEDRPRGGDP